jgi:sugar phosphate isomerase/epimerase
MKISLYTRISDLIPTKETFFDRVNNFLFNDPKRKMFKNLSADFIFSSLKKSGVEGLELIALANLPEKDIQIVNKMAQKHCLKIFSIHQSNDSLLEIDLKEIERLCKIANAFFAEVIVLHINALKNNLSDKTFIVKLKDLQKRYKVKFAIENVVKTPFTLDPRMYKTEEFSQMLRKLDLDITFDTTHVGQAHEDILNFYRINKARIINIHLSDYKNNWLNTALYLANDTHLPLGQGELPIVEFLQLLKKENYQGLITMEINGNLEELCQNAGLIKKMTER